MDKAVICQIDEIKRRAEFMDDLLECLADVAANDQPNMMASLFGALKLAREYMREIGRDIERLKYDAPAQ